VQQARHKLVKGQTPFLGVLLETLGRVDDRAEPGSTTPGAG